MDQLMDTLQQLPGDKPEPNQDAKAAARQRLATMVESEATDSVVKRTKFTMARRLSAVGTVAAAALAVMLVAPGQPADDTKTPQALDPLNILFTEAASAAEANPAKVTDVWYSRDRIVFRGDSGAVEETIEEARWLTRDGQFDAKGVSVFEGVPLPDEESWEGQFGNGEVVSGEEMMRRASAESWDSTMMLPTEIEALQAELNKTAQQALSEFKKYGPMPTRQDESFFKAVTASNSLAQPLKPETRRSMFTVLGELANAGALKDLGTRADSEGRTGRAFGTEYSEGDNDFSYEWIVDPINGDLLETKSVFDEGASVIQTVLDARFVSEVGAN